MERVADGLRYLQHREGRDARKRSRAPYGEAAIVAPAPAPGDSALDVGCGFGSTTRELAHRIGPSGRVLGIDLSEPFIAAARSEAPSNVRYLCVDAQTHTFESSFDLYFSRFGVMFFEDPAAAFANLCRALRPGGRFAAVAWASPEQNAWVEVPLRVLRAHLPAPPAAGSAGPRPLSPADPPAVARPLPGAGLAQAPVPALALPSFAA